MLVFLVLSLSINYCCVLFGAIIWTCVTILLLPQWLINAQIDLLEINDFIKTSLLNETVFRTDLAKGNYLLSLYLLLSLGLRLKHSFLQFKYLKCIRQKWFSRSPQFLWTAFMVLLGVINYCYWLISQYCYG